MMIKSLLRTAGVQELMSEYVYQADTAAVYWNNTWGFGRSNKEIGRIQNIAAEFYESSRKIRFEIIERNKQDAQEKQ